MKDPQRASFERRVRALADFGHRGSTTDRERAAADYLVEELRSIGLEPQREPFTGSSSFGGRVLLHLILAVVAAVLLWVAPFVSLVLDMVVLASLWLEGTARGVWLSRPIVRRPSENLCAWLRTDAPRLRVIVSGHYDTQRTGLLWYLGKYLIPLFWSLPSFLKPPLLPVAAVVVAQGLLSAVVMFGGLTDAVSLANGAVLGLYAIAIFFVGQWTIGSFVPGASDNATGVAAALAMAEVWRAEPQEGIELVVLLPGCEESGQLGSAAWAERHRQELATIPTIFLNFDTLGMGTPRFFAAEIPMLGWPAAYPKNIVELARGVARETGLADPVPHTMPGPTDGLAFLVRRISGLTIVSFRAWGYMPWYHLPSDTIHHVDFDQAWRGVEFGRQLLEKCVDLPANDER